MTARLPNTFVLGAPKAGSTWLADLLRAHPRVFLPDEKELHFFSDDSNWARGVDWYRERFFAGAGDADIVAEATPTTMMYREAMRRIRELVPDAKLLAILREPGARAHSNWRHAYYRTVSERRPFAVLVEDELREGVPMPREDRCDPADLRHLSHGLYARQIENVLAHFPREQLHVVLLEDARSDPTATFAGVCDFLGIDPPGEVPATAANAHREFRPLWLWRAIVRHRLLEPFPGSWGEAVARRLRRTDRRPPPMDPAARSRLDEFYAEPNAQLAALLGRELPWTR